MANNDYITTDCKLTVSKNTAKLDEEIFLYKNDRNIKLLIEIVDNKYRYKSDDLSNLLVKYKASYAQVKWYKNAEVKKEFPIQATDDGKVVFVIEGELINEDTELGDYDLQLRLLNESQESIRSLPIIKGAVHILKPLFEEGDIAIVNSAIADVSMLSLDGDAIDTYNSDGTYNQTNWGNGDVISSAKLNKLEKVAKDNVDKVNKMPAKSIVEGGKIYLAKEDGTKLDSGTELPAGGSTIEVVNNLESDSTTAALSAAQGKALNTQYKDIANLSLTKHTDGKVYIKKQDGSLVGTGVEVGNDTDLSKVTMTMSGQTLKMLNDGNQIATVEIPTAVVTDEQLTTIIQSKIDDGTLTRLSLGDNSVSSANLQDKSITPNKTTFFKEKYINFAFNIGTLANGYNSTNPDYIRYITDYIDVRNNLNIYIKSWKMKVTGNKYYLSEVACYDSEKNYLGMGTVSHINALTETDNTTTYYFWMNSATLLENTKYIRIGYNTSHTYLKEGMIVSSKTITSDQPVDELEFLIAENYYEPLFNALIKDNSVGIEKINGTFTPSTTNFMIESLVNMINPAEVMIGRFFNNATTDEIGYFDASTVTGYIEVELGGKYYFYRENTSLDSDDQKIVVRGYDSNKTYLGILYGEFDGVSTSKGVSEFEITNENVKFIRFFYRNGENVILSKYNLKKYYAYGEYLSLDLPVKYKEFFIRNIMMPEITKALIKDNVSAVALEQNMRPLYNKKWVQIGDSLTDWGGGAHVDVLSKDLSAMDTEGDTGFMRVVRDKEGILFYNQGFAGAQWQLTKIDGSINDSQGNPITSEPESDKYCGVRRVDKLIENKAAFTPDIITILMGTNCADEGETTDTSDNLYTMCGAIRYCLENLLREFPTTPIGILLPPQRLEGNDWQEPRNEKIRTIAQYYSIPVLDLFHESQIVSANRVVVDGKPTSGNGSLNDGTHLGDVGKINLGRKLCNWLKTL